MTWIAELVKWMSKPETRALVGMGVKYIGGAVTFMAQLYNLYEKFKKKKDEGNGYNTSGTGRRNRWRGGRK